MSVTALLLAAAVLAGVAWLVTTAARWSDVVAPDARLWLTRLDRAVHGHRTPGSPPDPATMST